MGFLLDEKVLYKKGKDHILLRCVDSFEANRIIEKEFVKYMPMDTEWLDKS